MGTKIFVLGLIVAVLILLSMIFSASESAFTSINKLRIRVLRGKKDKNALKIGKLLDSKTKLLNTNLIGNSAVNIGVTAILTALITEVSGESAVATATFVATVLLLIFGEITPKIVATSHPERIASLLATFISTAMKVMSPFTFLFTKISDLITLLPGFSSAKKSVSYTEEEIKTFIDAGEEEGVLDSNEKAMLSQVFKFKDLNVKTIMIPRQNISAVNIDTSFDELMVLAATSGFSRFPVYDGDLDHICGIVYIKDLLFFENEQKDFRLKDVLRPPLFILENRRISVVNRIFRENNQTMAIIIDEYSGTSGLVTLGDLSKEIFAAVFDGQDQDFKTEENYNEAFIIPGNYTLTEFEEKTGILLESEYYNTVAGYILEKTGKIPEVEDFVENDELQLTVEEMEGNRIKSVSVRIKGRR